jgi:hypothetical protein
VISGCSGLVHARGKTRRPGRLGWLCIGARAALFMQVLTEGEQLPLMRRREQNEN